MKVSKAYGTSAGKGVPARHTFVIDKEGVLRKVYTKVTPAKHPQEVLDFVKTLK
jgi:peroxiredoxin Q/BCP